jgi:hypothetical protein
MDRQNNEAKERKEGGKRKRKRKNEVTNISLRCKLNTSLLLHNNNKKNTQLICFSY